MKQPVTVLMLDFFQSDLFLKVAYFQDVLPSVLVVYVFLLLSERHVHSALSVLELMGLWQHQSFR